MTDLTRLLTDWRNGDDSALEKVISIVYSELKRIASRYMRSERTGHTLQASALVNEAYLRLAAQRDTDWQNRGHFFAVSARIMRHLLVDHARSRHYAKRGGGVHHLDLNEAVALPDEKAAELVALDDALKRLAVIDPRKNSIVELRYFAGLSVEETAHALGTSAVTVKREWAKAKAWLYLELNRTG